MILVQTAKYLSILSTLNLIIINFTMYLHFVREGARNLVRVHVRACVRVYRGQRPTLAESILSCHLWDIGIGLRLSGLCINASLYHLTAPRLAFLKSLCVNLIIYVCVPHVGIGRGQSSSLDLEFQALVSYLVWVLGTKLGPYERCKVSCS